LKEKVYKTFKKTSNNTFAETIAVNYDGELITDSSDIPYKIINGKANLDGKYINVECIPCPLNC